jgi:pyruvate, orthophosphate dikinase
MSSRWVYGFEQGTGEMRDLLGGKGAGIAEMIRAGIPVPPGFTVTTEACRAYYAAGGHLPRGLWEQVELALARLEATTGKRLGEPQAPLLVSVRSGAKVSMPGMMDTVLNLGLNQRTAAGLAELTSDARFAFDAYRRLIQLFGTVVMGIDGGLFRQALQDARDRTGAASDPEISAGVLEELVARFRAICRAHSGADFPEDPQTQLRSAVEAVFRSWNSPRAITYRRIENIPDDLGTAVNVQAMVFGNMGRDSGTGVAFTRNPITGEKTLYGDFLANAQGEDVVAGIRDPEPISTLRQRLPAVYEQFHRYAKKLEAYYRDVQDVEFTVERGRLYLLQTRSAKRTGAAAVKIAVDMAAEGLLSEREAVLRVEPRQVEQMIHPRVDPGVTATPVAGGVPASPGAATGAAVFDPDRAEAWKREGRKVLLVRVETSPSDVHGMVAAEGVLTSVGGTASHAALVARGMGIPCVVGASEIQIDLEHRAFVAGSRRVGEGEEITIDGTTGAIYRGRVPAVSPRPTPELQQLLSWADRSRRLQVWANADYPRDAEKALENGAEGIGLCRTEHMFMEEDRLPIVQAVIMATTREQREPLLQQLLPIQRQDFLGILRIMSSKPVVIRLIDPPLHEFLPNYDQLVEKITELRLRDHNSKQLADLERVKARLESLREENPMLGLRGVRLSILYPEIARMQVRAIMEAACQLAQEGLETRPEIMIPLVGMVSELEAMKRELEPVAEAVQEEAGVRVAWRLGTMIELPRAALTAGEIARVARFFSFGTNDLTQTVFGFSRDDAEGKFIAHYLTGKILAANPFTTLDREGVGVLMGRAVAEGRKSRPELEIGICGEHGGDPASIRLCHELELDYVSCSPYRIPVARLAAAQAALTHEDEAS